MGAASDRQQRRKERTNMKTILRAIAVGVSVALITAAAPTKSYAGDHEWATVGKVLTGIGAVGLFAVLASQADHHAAPHDGCAQLPPPPPTVYAPPPPPPQQWIPGHYECRRQRVCLPAHWESVTNPAQYGWVWTGYRYDYTVVRPPTVQQVWVPERFTWQETKVWVPSHFEVGALAYNR
jgi:hypothetical protein